MAPPHSRTKNRKEGASLLKIFIFIDTVDMAGSFCVLRLTNKKRISGVWFS
jgi:hypothetical protein